MILATGMRLAIAGIVIGLVGAGLLCRALYGFLVGVTPIDPATYIAVSTILLVVALFSAWAPGRRAARVDPMVALRAE